MVNLLRKWILKLMNKWDWRLIIHQIKNDFVAQWLEYRFHKPKVEGSSPSEITEKWIVNGEFCFTSEFKNWQAKRIDNWLFTIQTKLIVSKRKRKGLSREEDL